MPGNGPAGEDRGIGRVTAKLVDKQKDENGKQPPVIVEISPCSEQDSRCAEAENQAVEFLYLR